MSVPESVKRVVHAGSVSVGWLTAPARLLPSFLLCGGQRCGTTSMYRALAGHPSVRKAVLHKGVHYFDVGYRHSMRWYRGHFPVRRGTPVQTFESSPYYLYHPLAVERFVRDLPGIRLLVLVRDPVQRAHSQHAHEVARGFESEVDFGRALRLEPARLRGQQERLVREPTYYSFAHQHHAYRERGEYVRYLDRLATLAGRDRVHVVQSAEFFANPKPVFDEVLDFLNLPRTGYPDFEVHNAAPRVALDPGIRRELTEHFAPHDERLTGWLGRVPAWRT